MALQPGTRLGAYEILSAIGAGGMGEVYRARDTRLKRDVALKVLPDALSHDPDRLARFQREAEVLATLNHPNIATIYGLEHADGVYAIVMELVEGETLAQRLTAALRLNEVLQVAREVADALQAAHDRGIVHRDLKPANIAFTLDGHAKVLDFGLAKATDSETRPDLTNSPTLSVASTRTGVILGTAAYMSPEQAQGRATDKRTDLWAFGCVMYEMLTGKRAFKGDNVADTLANVLKSAPDWEALASDVPDPVRGVVTMCLEKDRPQRMADISVARFLLSEKSIVTSPGSIGLPTRAVSLELTPWRRLVRYSVPALVVGSVVTGATVWLTTRPASSARLVTRFNLTPSGAATLILGVNRDLAITPDGTHIVYDGIGTNATQFFVRGLDQLDPTPLPGLGAPRAPFPSPDGQWIGFVDTTAGADMKKVAITGGPPLLVCALNGQFRGASWGDDGNIIFATSDPSTGLQRVSAAGGKPTVLATPNHSQGEAAYLWPEILPGGHAVLFTILPATGGTDASQVAVLDLRTGAHKILVRGGSQAHYVSSGHVVYAVAGALRAVAFDLKRLEATGAPVPVVADVLTAQSGTATFDLTNEGTLVYVAAPKTAAGGQTMVWVDRQGREEPIGAAARAYVYPRLSPDGTRVAIEVRDQQNDIWVWDFARETLTRVTHNPSLDSYPVWMPDGQRLVFGSGGTAVDWIPGSRNLFSQAADGTGSADRLTQSSNSQVPSAISSDGRRLVFREGNGPYDLMMLLLSRDETGTPAAVEPKSHSPLPLVQTPFDEKNGEISFDGRWLAYESNDSGNYEVYVRPFPDVTAGRWQVSTGGGTRPVWARNGRELFYLATSGAATRAGAALMSVPVQPGARWAAGTPVKVFEGRYFYNNAIGALGEGRTFDVSPDGRRFLMLKSANNSDVVSVPQSLIVVQNWTEELKRVVPGR